METFPFDPSTDLPTGVELQDLIDQAIKLNSKDPIRFPFWQNIETYKFFLHGNVTIMLADPKNPGGE